MHHPAVTRETTFTRIQRFARCISFALALVCPALDSAAGTNVYSLGRSASPTNNPLKGFMPYSGNYTTFPHSMEWNYVSLRDLMSGPTNFNWSSLETLLNAVAGRGHQTVFRVYVDYPGKSTGLPQYLLDAGLETHSYSDYGNNGRSVSPDYENPLLRTALTNFIAALGERYDGDPRVGFVKAGLLGFWGEWHTYPHETWYASTAVENEVLNAFELAFTKTRLVVRRPAGTNPSTRKIGYHDDSFAFETVDPPNWMFLGLLKAAGEMNKWRTQPIGGEVRPEVQPCMWNTAVTNCVPAGQEFDRCVDLTHASWMLNHRAFSPGFSGAQKTLALAGSVRLGYEMHVSNAVLVDVIDSSRIRVDLQLRNAGVAPFYYDWPVQLGLLNSSNALVQTWNTPWKLSSLLPAATNTLWSWSREDHGLQPGAYTVLLRVLNPLTNGVPFRFANDAQDIDVPGWLTLGQFTVTSGPFKPSLRGSFSDAAFALAIRDAAPGPWAVEGSTNLADWVRFFVTNTTTPDWSVMDEAFAATRFYRVVSSP
ncbi:MAG TPA: DUF4832 domain-containing protein [Verrucomicrobiae bacterium]|nr:DUF4832 domain-containing protein [Verrucomicrobiae bacterium]